MGTYRRGVLNAAEIVLQRGLVIVVEKQYESDHVHVCEFQPIEPLTPAKREAPVFCVLRSRSHSSGGIGGTCQTRVCVCLQLGRAAASREIERNLLLGEAALMLIEQEVDVAAIVVDLREPRRQIEPSRFVLSTLQYVEPLLVITEVSETVGHTNQRPASFLRVGSQRHSLFERLNGLAGVSQAESHPTFEFS